MIKLSIIIVSFNTPHLLHNCLESIIQKTHHLVYEIIIIDNGSNYDLEEEILNFKKIDKNLKINLIQNQVNLGFTKACNQGIKKAKGKYVLLLNSDTLVLADTLLKTVNFLEKNPLAGAVTCRIELPNGKIDPASHRGFPTPWNAFCYFSGLEKLFPKIKIFGGYHQTWQDLDKIHEIDACSGAFFLVRKSVIDKVGLLDERFFMYAEDLDWAYRIKKAGFKIFYYPKTKIIHFKNQSGIKNLYNDRIKLLAKENFYKTMKLFYQKHYLKKYPRIVYYLVLWGIWFVSKIRK